MVGVIVKIVIEQTAYGVVRKYVLLSLVIHRLFYRFFFQEFLWRTIVIKIPVWFTWLTLLLICKSSRITIVGEENLKKIEKKQRVIFAIYHGHYTLLLASLRTTNAVTLVHWSFRGNYIAQLFSTFNYRIVRTSRGGMALRELIEMIKQGYSGFIAVDGPQGPARKTKPGIIYIAQKTGAKIVPMILEAHRGLILRRRWDNHFIPLPFNNITVLLGESIDVEPDDSLKAKGEEVNSSLLKLTKKKKGSILSLK